MAIILFTFWSQQCIQFWFVRWCPRSIWFPYKLLSTLKWNRNPVANFCCWDRFEWMMRRAEFLILSLARAILVCGLRIFSMSFAVADVLYRFYRTMCYVYHLHKIRNIQTKSTIFTFQAIFRPCLLHGAAFSKDCYTIETTVNSGGCVFVCTSVCVCVCVP